MRPLLWIFPLLLLVGCQTVTPVIGPDGTQNYQVSCQDLPSCYADARQACNGNYKIVSTAMDIEGSRHHTSTIHEMLVKCDNSQPPPVNAPVAPPAAN